MKVITFIAVVIVVVVVIVIVIVVVVITVAMIMVARGFLGLWIDDRVDAKNENANGAEEDKMVKVWGEIFFDPARVIEVEQECSPGSGQETEKSGVKRGHGASGISGVLSIQRGRIFDSKRMLKAPVRMKMAMNRKRMNFHLKTVE